MSYLSGWSVVISCSFIFSLYRIKIPAETIINIPIIVLNETVSLQINHPNSTAQTKNTYSNGATIYGLPYRYALKINTKPKITQTPTKNNIKRVVASLKDQYLNKNSKISFPELSISK